MKTSNDFENIEDWWEYVHKFKRVMVIIKLEKIENKTEKQIQDLDRLLNLELEES